MKKRKLLKIIELQTQYIEKLKDNIEQLQSDYQDLSGTIDVLLDEDLINEISKIENA